VIPPLSYILIPPVTAFLGALLAILLTPRFQHYFWKRQRREELRFTVVTEVNKLAAQFMMTCYGKDIPNYIPPLEPTFYESWIVLDGQVKVLFSDSTYETFDKMWRGIITEPFYNAQKSEDRIARVNRFQQARDTAMQSFYREIGILQGENKWSRFKRRFKG
jgi:hypothetical protein